MAKKTMYSFTEKIHSENGKISSIMGGVSIVLFLGMVYTSYYMRGEAGIYAGAFGVSGMLFALVGFIIGIKSFSEKNIKYKYPKLGSVLCGVAFVIWLGIFVAGM